MTVALGLNLRYEPNKSVAYGVHVIIDFDLLAQIDRGIVPLHKNLLCSFYNAILTELWLKEVSHVATLAVHDTEPLP